MSKFIAIDCGKYNTKASYYDEESGKKGKFKFRTKASPGTFADDMFGKGTYIVQIDDGPVWKIGTEAKKEPDMETSKKTEIHQVCTMSAIAMVACDDKPVDVNAVIGIPLDLAEIPEERISYKDYILGKDGEAHTVKFKTEPNGPVRQASFRIQKRLVYPEGIGVLYEYPAELDGTVAIIDIGNLNTNHTYADRYQIMWDSCFTDELGGKVLIANLAQALSSELGARCDENLIASTLLKPYESRHLVPANGNEAIKTKSKEIIDSFLLDHVKTIRSKCDLKKWPLEFMRVVCIGGTSKLLTKELHDVFGANVLIPNDPEYVNAEGFLKKLCADHDIDITKAAAKKTGKGGESAA